MDSVKIGEELLIPAGRHTLAPEEVRARQRERLLRAMGHCVSERGYTETTIADVVRVARTSRSVFYRHFADKEQCFLETYRKMTKVRIRASLAAAAEKPGWQAKLDAGIATYFRWMAEHPEAALATVIEVHAAGRPALKARSRALREWMRTIDGVAAVAREAGVEIELPEADCAAIVVTAEAYVHEYALRGRVRHVAEKAPAVQALARSLFERRIAPAIEPGAATRS
jgi:AcrR family transcriptional regulator